MKIPPLPASHDLVRLDRSTEAETVEAVLSHLRRSRPPWNYELARKMAPAALAGELPLSALEKACKSARTTEIGRKANFEVLEAIRTHGIGRSIQCYRMADGYLKATKDVTIKIAADFYYVEDGIPKVLWLQPRRSYSLNQPQLGTFCTLLRMTLLRGDFADADVEILDLSASPGTTRAPRVMSVRELPYVSQEQADLAVARVVNAYEAIKKMELVWDGRKPPKKPRPSDQQEMGF